MTAHFEAHRHELGDYALEATDFKGFGKRSAGKVRDIYHLVDGTLALVTTDRASAFDYVWGTLPLKGQMLNLCAAYWFRETSAIVDNHVLGVPDPAVTHAIACKPLPVEFVVRGFLTGTTDTSIWNHYQSGARMFCGHRLAEGMVKHQQLADAIVTPSTKAEQGGHDRSVSRRELLEEGVISARDFDEAAEAALAVFAHGQTKCAERGLILVDTKYEFGRDEDGQLRIIDEVHTPDSSRYWLRSTYEDAMVAGVDPEALDKDYLRRWLRQRGWSQLGPDSDRILPDELRLEASRRYLQACEMICGPLPLAYSAPLPRIEAALAEMVGDQRERLQTDHSTQGVLL